MGDAYDGAGQGVLFVSLRERARLSALVKVAALLAGWDSALSEGEIQVRAEALVAAVRRSGV